MTNKAMLRRTLADRVGQLMERDESLDTQAKLGAVSGLGQSTIGRLLRAEVGASIDNVEQIARAFRVSPVLLLVDSAVLVNLLESIGKMPVGAVRQVVDYASYIASQYGDGLDGDMTHTKSREFAAKTETNEPQDEGTQVVHEQARTLRRAVASRRIERRK